MAVMTLSMKAGASGPVTATCPMWSVSDRPAGHPPISTTQRLNYHSSAPSSQVQATIPSVLDRWASTNSLMLSLVPA